MTPQEEYYWIMVQVAKIKQIKEELSDELKIIDEEIASRRESYLWADDLINEGGFHG